MAHADDAQGEAPWGGDAAGLHPGMDGAIDPLSHGRGVAAGGTVHGDALGGTVSEVDVVGADGRRADEAHTTAVEQTGVAAGAGAHDERIGVTHGLGGNGGGLQIQDLGSGLDQAPDVRDMAIDNDSHLIINWVTPRAMQPQANKSMNT